MTEEMHDCPACPEGAHDRITWHELGMICGRCNKHTGNNNQGHYWRFCYVLAAKAKAEGKSIMQHGLADEFHFCCPDDCELENR